MAAAEKCPKCGSTNTVRHVGHSELKPNWLHCNEVRCSYCAETPAARRGGGKADGAASGELDDRDRHIAELTVEDLRKLAEDRGIDLAGRRTKAEIVDALDAAEQNEGESSAGDTGNAE